MSKTALAIGAVTAAQPSPSITVTLESTGIFLGALVSASLLITAASQVINKFNNLSVAIKEVKDDLKDHASQEGHERLLQRVIILEKLDKKLDLHIQDYTNRKDTTQMLFGQLNEKIDHKFNRLYSSMRDIESHLQSNSTFRMRQYHESTSE